MSTARELAAFQQALQKINKETERDFKLDPKYPNQPLEAQENSRLEFKITELSAALSGTFRFPVDASAFTDELGKPMVLRPEAKDLLKRTLMKFWENNNRM